MRHIKIEAEHTAFDRLTKIFTKIVSTAKTNKEIERDLIKAGNAMYEGFCGDDMTVIPHQDQYITMTATEMVTERTVAYVTIRF